MVKSNNNPFDESNEVNNSFIKWGVVGDYVLGTLISSRQVKSTLPDRQGEKQFIYEIKVKEGQYHDIDEKKRVDEEPTVLEPDLIISVGGRKAIDGRMRQIKLGQIFGLKLIEIIPAKTKGYNDFKSVKVFASKNADGTPQMDTEWLAEQEREKDEF